MKIMVIDDHALFREGLAQILLRLVDDIEIYQADSAEDGMYSTAAYGDVDLVLMDINLPGISGIEGLQVFRRCFPDCPVVMLAGSDDHEPLRQCIEHGAQGYIHKSASANLMLAALRKVLDGDIGICPPPSGDVPPEWANATATATVVALTPRQIEVLSRLCRGSTNKEIARDLGMSDNTVRVHLAVIFRTLGAKTRTQAAMLARQQGLV